MKLMTPFRLAHLTLGNRIVSTAHSEQLAVNGLITPHLEDYHLRRARGGAGLIIAFGSASVSPTAANRFNPALWNAENEPALRRMADAAHAAGTALIAQATHRGAREEMEDPDLAHVAPSAGAGFLPKGTPRVLSEEDIRDLVRDYADVAARLYRCGWDGIEVTSYGTHLLEQFWSPVLNQRDDRYGGTPEKRLRFGTEVLRAVRDAVPGDFVVALRMSLDTRTTRLGLSREDLLHIATHYDALGVVDLFDIVGSSAVTADGAVGTVPTADYPRGVYRELAARAKAHLRAPVLVAGRILDAREADDVIEAGEADLVGMTRAMIADPRLAGKIAAGEPGLVRPCISINEGCRRVGASLTLACSVNPEVAHPELATVPSSARAGTAVVVGAGPAGLEAARLLAQGGRRVVLLERDERIGGRIDCALLADPDQIHRYRQWAERALAEHDVDVRLGTPATPSVLAGLSPDHVVHAGGAKPVRPAWLDSAQYEAHSDVDCLTGAWTPGPGEDVVVYDPEGYSAGTVIALRLAGDIARRVTLVTPLPAAAGRVEAPNQVRLTKQLLRSPVRVLPHTELVRADDGTLFLRNVITRDATELGRDAPLVVCGYRAPDDGQLPAWRAACPDARWHVVGDASSPGLIRHAITAGARLAHEILRPPHRPR
ncbi:MULTISPECIES: FAD-dependent oxidoreductase [Streptomyces]|uniref:oxidoreductase n=1 Tax=Streptomyces lycopersici TaxID=2974589 RepID=UPI0021CE33D4|nr:FAD-dependent oxidoreductase [Streptomyces sp. NEAU-383]